MTKEQLIASYPGPSAIGFFVLMLMLGVFFIMGGIVAAWLENVIAACIICILAAVLIIWSGYGLYQEQVIKRPITLESWKATAYQEYLKTLPVEREKVIKFELGWSDKEATVFIESDATPYEKLTVELTAVEESKDNTTYIEYVQVSGLESVHISDRKELVKLYYASPSVKE